MDTDPPLSRRDFLASSSVALGAAALGGPLPPPAPPERLAIEGGPKAVAAPAPKLVRWGEPEKGQLDAMLGQDSLFYWKGPRTRLFLERFREICPLPHAMSCSSGTAALHIAVAAAGIAPGDEVITSPITDIGTVIGVLYQQAVPVFADLGRNTYNLDPADVERRITPRTRAIIAVHLAGNPCDMDSLKAIAARHDLVLIEDCAQAWGASYACRPIGTIGDAACFSLQNSKQVTCGDGGVVASADATIGPRLQPFGDKGMDRVKGGGLFEHFATNYRMSEPQAAVAAAQMGRVGAIAEARARLGSLLNAELAEVPGVEPPAVRAEDRCTYWFYMARIRPEAFRCTRTEFVKALAAEGAPAAEGYIPVPLYGNPVFKNHGFFAGRWPLKEMGLTRMDYAEVSCPEAEAILKTCFRLMIHEAMSDDHVRAIAAAVRKVARHYAA
ncbi:DegT/DnrJ/EryC1/StrS family aminotransferase [Paludisphaera sp.]|uniref:DegT/DnrJ/EryC1/StrS family aminotransferase n=1 Tax=Paludisphaera sp. TaxID=2017432 RepID=UPI00301BF172